MEEGQGGWFAEAQCEVQGLVPSSLAAAEGHVAERGSRPLLGLVLVG